MAQVLTNTGIAQMISALNSHLSTPYIGWGTGVGTAAVTDTALFTESDSRVAATDTIITTSVTNDTLQAVGTMTAGSNETITNVGLLDASASGNLYVHADFTGIPLSSGNQIQFTIKIQQQ